MSNISDIYTHRNISDVHLPNPEICQITVTISLVNIPRILPLEKCHFDVSRVVPWRDFYLLNTKILVNQTLCLINKHNLATKSEIYQNVVIKSLLILPRI